jgi:hypothetical protein
VPRRLLRIVFWSSLILTLGSLFALATIDEHLKNSSAPMGIVSFELCAFQSTCSSIQESWDAAAKLNAAMSLGLDYLFMLTYPAAISCGLWLLSSKDASPLRLPMAYMAYAVWLAGASDAIENYHLFQMLIGQPVSSHQWPATLAASLKFFILVPALVLWLVGLLRSVLIRNARHISAT